MKKFSEFISISEGDVIPFKKKQNYDSAVQTQNNPKISKLPASTLDVSSWAKKHLENDDASSVTKSDAYKHYCSTCKVAEPVHPDSFHSHMNERGYRQQKIAGHNRYIGVKIKE